MAGTRVAKLGLIESYESYFIENESPNALKQKQVLTAFLDKKAEEGKTFLDFDQEKCELTVDENGEQVTYRFKLSGRIYLTKSKKGENRFHVLAQHKFRLSFKSRYQHSK